MSNVADVEAALRAQLPVELHVCVPALAAVIVDLHTERLTPAEATQRLQAGVFAPLRTHLAGQTLAVDTLRFEIAPGGDTITVGDVSQAKGVALGRDATAQVVEGSYNTVAQAAPGGTAINVIVSTLPASIPRGWLRQWSRWRKPVFWVVGMGFGAWLIWTIGFVPLTHVLTSLLLPFSPAPAPILPQQPVIVYQQAPMCVPQPDLVSALQSAAATIPGAQVAPTDQQPGSAQAKVSLACQRSSQLLTVTIDMPSQSPVRIPLLQEPRQVVLATDQLLATRQIAEVGALYGLGQYQAAADRLGNQAIGALSRRDDRDRAWLIGNIRFRLEDWDGAIIAYTQSIEGRDPADPAVPQLLANRALTRLYAREATDKTEAAIACRDLARPDIQQAVQSSAMLARSVQFDLQVIYGRVFLQCVAVTDDGEKLAPAAAAQALAMVEGGAPAELALAYDLMARVREQNRALPLGSEPRQIQDDACQAIRLDPSLATPYETLGRIYARYRLSDAAGAQFRQAEQRSPMSWQRWKMIQLRLQLPKWPDVVPGGLPAVTDRRPLGSCG
jgi:tetratricopeptide (TPR) repeat protein